MRTSVTIDDSLLDRAKKLSGIDDTAAVVRAGLEALIAREGSRRLAALGGTVPKLRPVTRRRSESG